MPEELAQARRNLGVVSSTGHPTRAMVPTRLLATRLLATRLLASVTRRIGWTRQAICSAASPCAHCGRDELLL